MQDVCISEFASIHDRLTASQQKTLAEQHLRESTHTLEIGDLVYHQQHVRHSKLDSFYQGPYRIIEKFREHKVKILHLGSSEQIFVHEDHLQKVHRGIADLYTESTIPFLTSSSTKSLIHNTHSSYEQKLNLSKCHLGSDCLYVHMYISLIICMSYSQLYVRSNIYLIIHMH